MINPALTQIIVGPPGTGKTTTLINRVQELIEHESYNPEEIGFVAFTRKAAHEAKERASEKLKLNDEQLIWFRTLHSTAFLQLGLSRNNIMGQGDYLRICGHLGLSITFKGITEDETISGLSKGDRLFFMENMARAQLCDLRTYWERFPNEDIHWYELEQLRNTLSAYKDEYGKQDFTDIVTTFCKSPVVPPIRVLFVDEAQDLTPLQWEMVGHLASDKIEKIFIAGDDDQAIFKWAGADVDHFINLEGDRIVLPQSYRVPSAIQTVAHEIVSRITNRIPKEWKSTPDVGQVIFVNSLQQIDMNVGSWYLLGRNTYTLEEYNRYCIQNGLVFNSILGSPVKSSALEAIVIWENLRKGQFINSGAAKRMYEYLESRVSVEWGKKTELEKIDDNTALNMEMMRQRFGLIAKDVIWHEALKIDDVQREYFLSALRRGERLLKEPRIRINTIHGVKGGEADNVVIVPDMAYRTYQEYQNNPDDEHRVWYVAVTRARKNLFIMSPSNNRSYQI